MAHQFDTGALAPQRTRLEDGAVALLSGLKKVNGGYLAEVFSIGFTLETTTNGDDVAQFVAAMSRAPSIAVHAGDRVDRPNTIGGFTSEGTIDLIVYFSSNNARGAQIGRMKIDTAGLASDTADPGLHIIMEHAKELLIGQRAGAPFFDIKQCVPDSEREYITAQPITIWKQVYKVKVMTQIDEFRTVEQLLSSIRFRSSQNPAEAHLPAPKTDTTTLDVNVDGLH
jgi:hypothetical protein